MTLSPAEVAEAVGGPTAAFTPQKGVLSTLFHWFADESRLCVVAADESMTPVVSDIGFSHALGHLGDRDLIIAFPAAGAEAVAHRLPFLEVQATCWRLAESGADFVAPLRPSDVLELYEGLRGGTHDVAKGLLLVEPLLAWLAERDGLVVDERKSYRTWQYKGRQVLTLRMASHNVVEIVAGVNYSDPKPGMEPVVLRLGAAISDYDLARARAAVDTACSGRDAGTDIANAEHLLQERLRKDWKHLGLRAAPLREVPVRRPIGYGYIDLAGAGVDGRIHVVETKLGPFDRLVVQGLDCWIWANANRAALATILELSTDAGIEIDYVVAEKTPGRGVIGSYTSGQAEALWGAIRWRFTTVRNWAGTDAAVIQRLPIRTLPLGSRGRPAPRKSAPRWPIRLAYHLAERAAADGVTLGGGVFWPNATDGLEPAASAAYDQLSADGLAHHMIGHVRSSQAFALNLFAPLDEHARIRVAAAMGVQAREVSVARFEWSDPDDHLGERTDASPHATQVDVRFDCVATDGTKVTCLIEVKLSEPDFNPCSAWLSPRNDRLDVCSTSGPFGSDPVACFQLRNHDREQRRTYDIALGSLAHGEDKIGHGCWFQFSGNQVMRNTAVAASLVSRGIADRAIVALCAPSAHTSIWRRWSAATARLKVIGVAFVDLPAHLVLRHHPNASAMADRYLLTTGSN
jgi:hypothetical protein